MKLFEKYKALTSEGRFICNTTVGFFFGVLWAVIKTAIGVYEASRFLIAAALFSLAVGFSKFICLIGMVKYNNAYQKRLIELFSLFIVLSGIFYGYYNLRLLYAPSMMNYGLIPSIAIAAVSFFMFTKAIVNIFLNRKRTVYRRFLNVVSLITALTNIMLTQMCLITVQNPETDPIYNIGFALAIALFTIGAGIYCMIGSRNK